MAKQSPFHFSQLGESSSCISPETVEALRADETRMAEAREWFAKTLGDATDLDSLPIPQPELTGKEGVGHSQQCPLAGVTREMVKTLLQRCHVQESTVMQAAWGLLLATYSGDDKASWCTADPMMAHSLPLFLQTTAEMPVSQLLSTLEAQMQQAMQYAYYDYQDAVQDLGLQNQVLFVCHDPKTLLSPNAEWKLAAQLCETSDGYQLNIAYNTADWTEAFMTQLAACYAAILRSMCTADQVCQLLTAQPEQVEWLDALNDQPDQPDQPALTERLIDRWKKHVAERPNDVFCVAGDKQLTFAEADQLTDTLPADYAIPCGDHVVGFITPRNEYMVLTPLAIAKAGMTAMPLDGSYPAERLDFMKQDAAAYNGTDAFVLLYTSGTTGIPKGVMLSETNICTFVRFHVGHIGLTSQSRYATYAGYGFDAYQMDLWSCIWAGAQLHIIQDDIRFDLEGMNQYCQTQHITHCFMTTQMATQMVLNYPDIPFLQWLGTGGEKLMSLDPPRYRFDNCYGPTETTVYVCSHAVDQNEANIPIGKPNQDGTQMFIVNKYGHRVPWGAAGELLIAGPQVGLGYLNQPEKTAGVFVEWEGRRVYRTGDIVRYREDGNIEFVGRKDGQVKIRGFRIELKEVEAVIRQYDGIRDATVQAFDYPTGGKFIAAYVVSDQPVDVQALNAFILDRKPPYMVPATTMQIDAIPLNQNQKVNKRALLEPVLGSGIEQTDSAAPLNVLEQQLKQMVADIVNTEEFGITTDLRYVGLTSILAIKLATQVYKRFGVQLDAKRFNAGGNIQTIENAILETMLSGQNASLSPAAAESAEPDKIGLSFSQTGVYFECMKDPTSLIYNVPMVLTFPQETEEEVVRQAVVQATHNHPLLFARFLTDETGAVQVIGDREAPVEVLLHSMTEEEMQAWRDTFVRPFNLSKDRLFRYEMVRTEKALYLYCDIHHLVCDGYSYDLFVHEVCALMEGKTIEPEMCSYIRFVEEQQQEEQSQAFAEAKAFFSERLADVEEVTELAPDLTNPTPQRECDRVVAPILWADAERLAHQVGVNPSAVMLASVFYSLSRFAGTGDVCITTISNGRSNLKVANTMGMFVNTLALRARIEGDVTSFIRQTAATFETTLQHENYPFARIAADYDLKADIMFAYQVGVISHYSVNGQPVLSDLSLEAKTPKFKIAFYIIEVDGTPAVVIEYDDGMYSRAMMQSLAQSVSQAVSAFADKPDAPLASVSLLSEEKTRALDEFNRNDVPYDDTQTIVSLFRQQAAATPHNLALVYHDVRMTYQEVDRRTDAIAALIQQKVESGKENVVSVLIGRSEWMVLASLAVLKAGCAYQPLDPSYPADRLNFMMRDADARLLIADEPLRALVDEYQGETLFTADLAHATDGQPTPVNIRPEDLLILLYTSGSTGQPKGCQLEHGNLVAFCHWYQRYYQLQPTDKVAAYASYGFDACMMDMYPALTHGAAVYIIGDDIRLNLPDLNRYFNDEGITLSFMTTQVCCQFAANCDNHSLRHLSGGGEKMLPLMPPDGYVLHNGYGPTECTIFTTTYPLSQYEQNVPIGKALDNLKLFIIDKDLNRLPLGAAGELLVSGPQVSRGYLNQPQKTAETYIQWNGFRCYRTGDVVRFLPDGNIQFVGRKDGQVKIRGFRIELKEVEAVIREYDGIDDATVQAFDYPNGGKFIAAYVVSRQPVDVQALNDFIRQRKPSYMVPASTMQIDAIPLNQNQKVNKRALPAPQIQAESRDYVAPTSEAEKQFCDIFANILSMDKVGATDNFFELGGTSLMVTRVVIESDKAGHHVAYGDVFTHPTPQLLAQFVGGESAPAAQSDAEVEQFDYSGINAILQHNRIATFLKGERLALGDVLLTGATGYLGIHVLRQLIDSDAPTITCLVRGKDQQQAENRLKNMLFYYFDSAFLPLFGKRLFVVNGDVTSDLCKQVERPITTVFNCAANVKHFSKGTDIEDVNVGGAQRCVEFCLTTGAHLIHISTTSVGEIWIDKGDGAPVPRLDEHKLWFGQFLDNRYMHSKFLAERLVLDAVAHHGLVGKVMRVGNLAARSYDGEFQANFGTNSYMGRMKVFGLLGCCPYDDYDELTEFSPIDQTAKAVVLLATAPRECNLFQPFNNHTELLGDVLQLLEKIGSPIRFVEREEFSQALLKASQDPKKAGQLSAMLAYQDMAHGQKTCIIERDNAYTCAVLHRLGFHWPDTSRDYIDRMFTAIASLGFFDN